MSAFPTPYWAKCCKSTNSVQVSAVKPCNLLSSASDLKVFNPRFCRFLIRRLYSSLKPFQGTMPSVSPHETREGCGSGNMPFYWKQTAGCTCQLRPRWTESMLHIWTSHFYSSGISNQFCVQSIIWTTKSHDWSGRQGFLDYFNKSKGKSPNSGLLMVINLVNAHKSNPITRERTQMQRWIGWVRTDYCVHIVRRLLLTGI